MWNNLLSARHLLILGQPARQVLLFPFYRGGHRSSEFTTFASGGKLANTVAKI